MSDLTGRDDYTGLHWL